ncbi:unnamed protein product [Oncorhynchus mykiss]|uniref:Phospholipid scramblase n=1 Tax=Oncorhynchus mykiss TaxID=8022 RepID=A0A060W572_ONCMY|nr:unnamed protein product [Oncorhynchus mykiss]
MHKLHRNDSNACSFRMIQRQPIVNFTPATLANKTVKASRILHVLLGSSGQEPPNNKQFLFGLRKDTNARTAGSGLLSSLTFIEPENNNEWVVASSSVSVYRPKPDFKHGQIPFKCCVPQLEVQAPPGTTIGYVSQDWNPCVPKFSIKGANKETVMKLEGPCFACNCCGDVNFKLTGKDGGKPIGRISKQWSGLIKEVFTDTDNFGIQFPMDLDVKMKAVLMGTCFLIDFMFFEKVGNTKQRNTVFS